MPDFSLIKDIYCRLGDEESKDIFRARLDYSLLGDEKALFPIMKTFENTVYSDKRYFEAKETVKKYGLGSYVFGAGAYARMLLELEKDVKWKGVVLSSPREKYFLSYPVKGVKEFAAEYDNEYVFLPSKAYYHEMRKQLLDIGVSENRIIDMTVLFDITEGRQYFDLPYLEFGAKETFVDCGCYDGTSALGFIGCCNDLYEHIYSFEPDGINLKKIERFYREWGIEKYTLFNKGVWDKEEELSFAANGTANSHIQGIIDKNESRIEKVLVTKLDECLYDKDISFIKMDIEGAEYKALCGARGIIEKCKPKLAICVYHKPEDIWEIPQLILNFRSDYTLYLRHYSFRNTETVLYAL